MSGNWRPCLEEILSQCFKENDDLLSQATNWIGRNHVKHLPPLSHLGRAIQKLWDLHPGPLRRLTLNQHFNHNGYLARWYRLARQPQRDLRQPLLISMHLSAFFKDDHGLLDQPDPDLPLRLALPAELQIPSAYLGLDGSDMCG
jgi:hypothetical protein